MENFSQGFYQLDVKFSTVMQTLVHGRAKRREATNLCKEKEEKNGFRDEEGCRKGKRRECKRKEKEKNVVRLNCQEHVDDSERSAKCLYNKRVSSKKIVLFI